MFPIASPRTIDSLNSLPSVPKKLAPSNSTKSHKNGLAYRPSKVSNFYYNQLVAENLIDESLFRVEKNGADQTVTLFPLIFDDEDLEFLEDKSHYMYDEFLAPNRKDSSTDVDARYVYEFATQEQPNGNAASSGAGVGATSGAGAGATSGAGAGATSGAGEGETGGGGACATSGGGETGGVGGGETGGDGGDDGDIGGEVQPSDAGPDAHGTVGTVN